MDPDMEESPYYRRDLAYIHHTGFGDFSSNASAGLLAALRAAGINRGRVVDLGCGSGLWLREAVRAGHTAIGVDSSASMLKIARATAPGATLRRCSLHEFEFPPCDAVTAL